MPELPEVETTLRGIEKKVLNKKIISFVSREKKLLQAACCMQKEEKLMP